MDSSMFGHLIPTEKEINKSCGCFLLFELLVIIAAFAAGVVVGLILAVA